MKKNIINKIELSTISLIMSFTFIACSDWTDTESIDIDSPQVEHQNPALYKKYLENLRKYKESDHKVIYTWLDNENSELATNHSLRVEILPDSIDYVVFRNAVNLSDWEKREMESVKEKKGFKFLAQIDFDDILVEYNQLKEENDGSAPMPTFIGMLVQQTEDIIVAINKYNYDGLIVGYKGKRTIHMTEDEKAEYLKYQTAFMTIAENWAKNNKDKMIVFAGNPENVLYNFDFISCKHIIIRTETLTNASAIANEVMHNIIDGVPSDRYVVTANTVSADKTDTKTGYWPNAMKAITGTADWIIEDHNNFNVMGIGIYNISNDYYNSNLTFLTVRTAISTLNPSLK